MINLDEYESIGTHWTALYVKCDNGVAFNDARCFYSFGVKHISKEIKKFIGNRNITVNIFRVRTYDSIRSGYFCIGFIDFMLTGKSFLEYANLFSPNNNMK